MTTQAEQGVVVTIGERNLTEEDVEKLPGVNGKKTNSNLRIRKLTPKECWRLQGWDFIREDGTWDDTAFEKAKASGVSDSQLYKQAGNGCSANVVMAIGLRLAEIEKEGVKND